MKAANTLSAILLIIVTLAISGNITHMEDQDLARVGKIEGKYIFVMCQPVQEYEEVGRVNTALSALTNPEKDISELVKTLLKKGVQKEEKGKMESFDGMITEDGAVGIFIKYK